MRLIKLLYYWYDPVKTRDVKVTCMTVTGALAYASYWPDVGT